MNSKNSIIHRYYSVTVGDFFATCHIDDEDNCHPWISIYIVAHELAHEITYRTSRLDAVVQAGGLNESYSDIAG